jgi:hypothetical protein
MTRPSEYTRQNIMKAAIALFAERGYDGTSIRAIVSKARQSSGDQLPFQGQGGLYFEVLQGSHSRAICGSTISILAVSDTPREEACAASCISSYAPSCP